MKTIPSPGKAACLALALTLALSLLLPMPVLAAGGPGITTQPQSQSVLTGSNAVFTVVASGQTPLHYQWSFNGTNLTNGPGISGATNATLTVSNVTVTVAGNYQVVVNNSHGSVASSIATLTVLVPAAITAQPTNQSVLISNNVTFAVSATGTLPLAYQWYFDGALMTDGGRITGSATANLNISDVQASDAGAYQLIVTNDYGSATSAVANLTVLVPAMILVEPSNEVVTLSNTASLAVVAGGTAPLSYQWFFNGAPMADGGRVSGSATANLSIADAQFSDDGFYQVVITNNYGSITSATVVLGTTPLGTPGVVRFVNLNSTNPMAPYTDWSIAATNLQDAVDASTNGDFIMVTNGVYASGGRLTSDGTSNRVVVSTAVTIQSVNGAAATAIDGGQIGRCIYLTNSAVLVGFTLTNGTAGYGGGVMCASTNALLSNCILINNQGVQGGGVYCGTLNDCTISSNTCPVTGGSGGGAYACILNHCTISGNSTGRSVFFSTNATGATWGGGVSISTLNNCILTGNSANGTGAIGGGGGGTNGCILNNCTVSGNYADSQGGGLYNCTASSCSISNNSTMGMGGGVSGGTYDNCVLNGNSAYSSGGGVYWTTTLNNCLLYGNTVPEEGGGGAFCTFNNCTICGNTAYNPRETTGGGGFGCTMNNCIIYYNSGGDNTLDTLSDCCTPDASGPGCIANPPEFVNQAGEDFHLQTNSPCIDNGNNAYVSAAADLDGNPRIVNQIVDMGCYEYQSIRPLFIITQPASQTNAVTQTVSFTVPATGTPPLAYQWLFDGTNIPGATNSTLVLADIQLSQAGTYSVILSNSLAVLASSNATLTVTYPPPAITSQPANETIFAGSTASFSAAVLTYAPTVYQWFTNGVPLVDGGRISGSATTNLVISDAQISDSGSYQLIATNGSGSGASAAASLTVDPPTTAVVQPPNLTTNGAAIVTLTAAITGQGPFTYQWQFNGANLPGATGSTLTLNNVLDNESGAYSVIVGNAAGTVVSSNAMLTVVPWVNAAISTNLAIAGLSNAPVVFSLKSGGFQTNAVYQWQLNGTNLNSSWTWTNSTQSTSLVPYMENAGTYDIVATDTYESVTSSVVTLTVIPAAILTQPTNESVLSGSTATFSVVASGEPTLTYQWQFNGASIPGATNSSLTLTNVTPPQEGIYSVLIANAYTNIVSSNAALTVTALMITSQPTNRIAWPGGSATFTVNVAGLPPFGFDWQINGVDVPGVSTNVLTLTNIQPSQFGTCDVIVSNAWASTTRTNFALSFSQVAVWGGTEGESNLTAGLSNVVAIAGGGSSSFDCLALRSDTTVIHWPTPNSRVISNILAIPDQGGEQEPYYLLLTNETVETFSQGDLTRPAAEYTNIAAIAANLTGPIPVALVTNGTVLAPLSTVAGVVLTNFMTNAVAIAEGDGFYMALQPNGIVTAWGNGKDTAGTIIPPGLSNVIAIAAGYYHALALKSDGTVVAWGQNTYGQTNVPAGLSNVVAIAAGLGHSLALKADGTVVAWGLNSSGQTNVPVGLTNVIAIAAGEYQSMALIGNGPPVLHVPLSKPSVTANGFILTLPSQSGRVYILQYINSLSDTNWISQPLVPGTGGPLILTDPSNTNQQRFYRVQRW